MAGTFALMPPAAQKLFGSKNGGTIYGIVYSAFGVAAIGGSYFSKVGRSSCNGYYYYYYSYSFIYLFLLLS